MGVGGGRESAEEENLLWAGQTFQWRGGGGGKVEKQRWLLLPAHLGFESTGFAEQTWPLLAHLVSWLCSGV